MPSGIGSWDKATSLERKFRKKGSVGTGYVGREGRKAEAGVWQREMSGEFLLSLTASLAFSTDMSTGNVCWF